MSFSVSGPEKYALFKVPCEGHLKKCQKGLLLVSLELTTFWLRVRRVNQLRQRSFHFTNNYSSISLWLNRFHKCTKARDKARLFKGRVWVESLLILSKSTETCFLKKLLSLCEHAVLAKHGARRTCWLAFVRDSFCSAWTTQLLAFLSLSFELPWVCSTDPPKVFCCLILIQNNQFHNYSSVSDRS